jgi:hypothetical protein
MPTLGEFKMPGRCGMPSPMPMHRPVGRPEKIPGQLVLCFDESIKTAQQAVVAVGMADVELKSFYEATRIGIVNVPAGQEGKFAVRLKEREGVETVEFSLKHETMQPVMAIRDTEIPATGVRDEHGMHHGKIGHISLPKGPTM